jgi:flagellar biosynthetic protein FlhB
MKKEHPDFYLLLADPALAGILYDLQIFAPEDEGRTEEPTEKKIREARDKGQVARTQELPQSAVVIAGMLALIVFGSWIYDSIAGMTKYYLSSFSTFYVTEKSTYRQLVTILIETSKIIMPVCAAALAAAFISNVAQVGFQVSTHPLKLDWSKIKFDPATIMKKIFFSKQIAMNLFKSIFKVVVISLIAYLIISSDFDDLLRTPDISVAMALKVMLMSALKIVLWTSVLLLVLSVPDYFFQKHEFIESLKMTKQEIKEEWKETMGDPHIKARLKELQRELLMKNMIREVPKADVVVTNPTHYAVALKYDREAMPAPTVISKGVDSMALRIREIARENNIPIIENRTLAREIHARLEVGDIIPEDLFKAVAFIYKQLYEMKRYRAAI